MFMHFQWSEFFSSSHVLHPHTCWGCYTNWIFHDVTDRPSCSLCSSWNSRVMRLIKLKLNINFSWAQVDQRKTHQKVQTKCYESKRVPLKCSCRAIVWADCGTRNPNFQPQEAMSLFNLCLLTLSKQSNQIWVLKDSNDWNNCFILSNRCVHLSLHCKIRAIRVDETAILFPLLSAGSHQWFQPQVHSSQRVLSAVASYASFR